MTNSLPIHPDLQKETRARVGSGGDTPVTVIMAYDVPPFRVDGWLLYSERLAALAASRSACRRFEILHRESGSQRCSIRSDWDDATSFHRFVRESGILWLERAMLHPRPQVRITYRSVISELADSAEVASEEKSYSSRV